MIAILGYETSRTDELKHAFEEIGRAAIVVRSISELERARQIILPGCSSFSAAIRSIRDGGYLRPLFRAVEEKRCVLGIAQGMHLFFDVSYEDGQHTGLGLIPGKVARFDPVGAARVDSAADSREGMCPIYWNGDEPTLCGLTSGQPFFVEHVCSAEPLDRGAIVATCHHGVDFPALIRQDSLVGTAFLPERSGAAGRRVLQNIAAGAP